MGAPFDDFLISDLEDENMKAYKVYILPDAAYLSEAERRLVMDKCCKNGSAVIWIYASGLLGEKGFSLQKMEELTGFRTGCTEEPGEVTVVLTGGDHPYLRGLSNGTSYGTNGNYLPIDTVKDQAALNVYPDAATGFSVAPRLWISDEKAEVLGMLQGINKPGLAVKELDGWTSIYSSAPMIPKEILRNIAREKGCHIYTDFPGQLMACTGFVGFYAHADGLCRIKLPEKAAGVTEVFSGEKLYDYMTDEIALNVKRNTAYLFWLHQAG